mmetsp:Transcript_124147/g.312548  ORF Transcript_124147/g.312548 Transcript_124147/m.312548 type:complete len:346 (-) Transcript_124147:65-1102(-)
MTNTCSLVSSTVAAGKSKPLEPRPMKFVAPFLDDSAGLHADWCLPQSPGLLETATTEVPKNASKTLSMCIHSSTWPGTFVGDAKFEACRYDRSSVVGRVWELSQDPIGCHFVQEALGQAASEVERCVLAEELHGHVLQASRCPHGNHVLQKCIHTMKPESLQFIIDELLRQEGSVVRAAKHHFGCRIIQNLLKACPQPQVSRIAQTLLEAAGVLACHPHGSYVVQRMLEFGTEEQRYQLVRRIERSAADIALSAHGGAMIKAAIIHAAPEDRVWVARALAQNPQVILAMVKAKRGNGSVLLVLDNLPELDRKRLCASLAQHINELRASRVGSKVAAQVRTMLGEK